jgi:hypothetical protein
VVPEKLDVVSPTAASRQRMADRAVGLAGRNLKLPDTRGTPSGSATMRSATLSCPKRDPT